MIFTTESTNPFCTDLLLCHLDYRTQIQSKSSPQKNSSLVLPPGYSGFDFILGEKLTSQEYTSDYTLNYYGTVINLWCDILLHYVYGKGFVTIGHSFIHWISNFLYK